MILDALFKIAMKHHLGCFMVFVGGRGAERFILDSRKAMFKTLDVLDFDA